MAEGSKYGSVSGLPIRKPRKIPVMAPTSRTQSRCSGSLENNTTLLRDQAGPPRNRLGNRLKKPNLTDLRQHHMTSKPRLNGCRNEVEISRSVPDLSRVPRIGVRSSVFESSSALVGTKSLPKIGSLENVRKPTEIGTRVKPPSRIPTKPVILGKLKSENDASKKTKRVVEIGKKTVGGSDRARTVGKPVGKPMDHAKRKFGCFERLPGPAKLSETKKLSPTTVSGPLSVNSRTEECKKIVKKIMLDKTCSNEFEDSIGTFNSDEMADLLSNDSQLKHFETVKSSGDLDKSSKRNSSEFDDSIGSFFSDQMVVNLSKSTEFLNLTGSRQNFISDIPLVLSVSEDTDNITPELSGLSHVMDRTPSAEELPMECEAEPESINSTAQEAETVVSARSTSPTEELPAESLSSRTPNAAVSIITSITSIMSLDTGYQGDGELSRPESRNTEPAESRFIKLPIAENGIPVKAINFDDGKTMTDSDFFTESDADIHDDLSVAAAEIGSGKGDRKAQVIDGTLYGGAFIQGHAELPQEGEQVAGAPGHAVSRMVSTGNNNSNEDMESSGIYSDLEKKPEELGAKEKEPVSYLGMITEQIKTIQNVALAVAEKRLQQVPVSEGLVKSSSAESSSTVHEVIPAGQTKSLGSQTTVETVTTPSDRKDAAVKKAKSVPGRNVTSKMKGITEGVGGKESETRVRAVKKGKWDAVMDKIAQGKEENKYTPAKFRDVKSKVFQNMGPLLNARRSEGSQKTTMKTPPPTSQLKPRSRRSTRIRSSESSLVSPKSKQSRTSVSPNSSQRSSLSDISLSGNHQKSGSRGSKKRESISPPSNDSTNSTNTPTRNKLNNNDESLPKTNGTISQCRTPDLQNGNAVRTPSETTLSTMKTPSLKKTPTPRRAPVSTNIHRTASLSFKDSNHNGLVSKSGSAVIAHNNNNTTNQNNNNNIKSGNAVPSKTLKTGTRNAKPVQVKNGCLHSAAKDVNKALLKQLKHNSRAFESLAILFSYCANDLDAFSTTQLKRSLESEKSKFVQAQSDIEDLQSRLIRVREELNDKEVVITELNNDKISLGEQSEKFEKLVEELRNKLDVVTEQKREAESELLRECENLRCLKRELSHRTDSFEDEKGGLLNCLSEAKKENGILKSANREIKEEYDKCLLENQRLVEIISKRQNDPGRGGKENVEGDGDRIRQDKRRGSLREKSQDRTPDKSLKSSPTPYSPNVFNPKCLESEVESLRQVLALKTDEVTELRRQELSLRENADRVPKLLSTITMLEGKVEDLQTQLSSQTETVRDLFKSNEHLEDELKSANIQKTRLTHKNEELQYKLKQYAEAMQQLVAQKNLSDRSVKTEFSPVKSNSRKSDGNLDDSVKSHMKAVVEKSDSVSYMLEMTEDSSEIVTNIIRRAERLQSTGREQTMTPTTTSATSAKKKRSKGGSSSSGADGPSSRRNASADEGEFRPDAASTPASSPPTDSDLEGRGGAHARSRAFRAPNKLVKLTRDDFSTDSIEVGRGDDDDCEIIEITESFDRPGEMVTSTSSNSSSSSASGGSHFDIESDVFANGDGSDPNGHDHDDDDVDDDDDTESSDVRENGSIIRTYRRDMDNIKPILPVYKDLETAVVDEDLSGGTHNGSPMPNSYLSGSKNLVKIPKISGGEAMIGLSSDDEDIEKIKRIYD